jgi:elongation factor G
MPDFISGLSGAMGVTATGLLVVNSAQGVGVGTEVANRYASEANKPVVIVTNFLDHEKANFEKTVDELKASLGNKVTLVQYPVNPGNGFNAVVDVLKMKMYQWGADGGEPQIVEIPDSEADKANELHNELVEKAAENDERLMDLYFDKGSLSENEMREGIKLGMVDRSLYPVFCISAEKDMGIRRLMEFVCNVAPSPAEVAPKQTQEGEEIKVDETKPCSIFVFKTSIEQHVGEICYFKVITGTLKEGIDLTNSNSGEKERINQIYAVAGKNRVSVKELKAGDIGATVKLKKTKTNHTLCEKDMGIKFKELSLPNSKYRVAVKAVNEADEEKIAEILNDMHKIDRTYVVNYSKELKQLIVEGQGEYHINTLKWHFDNIYKVEVEFFAPKIPYRETITVLSAANYRHKKQSGGAGQFGEVYLYIEPYEEGMDDPKTLSIDGKEQKISLRGKEEVELPWGGKLVFCNCIVGGVIDARFLPAIQKGIMEKMEEGPLTGSYARDIRVCVYDGKMHPVDSNEISFKLAGRHAFIDAFKNAKPKILEPIYSVDVLVPSDKMGDVMSDLQTRRAMIEGMASESGFEKITAKVPLKEMDKYSTSLSSITNGRAMFNMDFSSYDLVPRDVQEALLKTYEELEEN